MQIANQNFKIIHTFIRWLVKGEQHFGHVFSLSLGAMSHPVITSVAADEVKLFQFWTALPCAVAVDSVLCRHRPNLPALSTKMSSVYRLPVSMWMQHMLYTATSPPFFLPSWVFLFTFQNKSAASSHQENTPLLFSCGNVLLTEKPNLHANVLFTSKRWFLTLFGSCLCCWAVHLVCF